MKVSKIVLRNKVEPGVENSIKIKDLSTNESRLHGNIERLKLKSLNLKNNYTRFRNAALVTTSLGLVGGASYLIWYFANPSSQNVSSPPAYSPLSYPPASPGTVYNYKVTWSYNLNKVSPINTSKVYDYLTIGLQSENYEKLDVTEIENSVVLTLIYDSFTNAKSAIGKIRSFTIDNIEQLFSDQNMDIVITGQSPVTYVLVQVSLPSPPLPSSPPPSPPSPPLPPPPSPPPPSPPPPSPPPPSSPHPSSSTRRIRRLMTHKMDDEQPEFLNDKNVSAVF
jgi:hypothetical protein